MKYGPLVWTEKDDSREDGLVRKTATAPGLLGNGHHCTNAHTLDQSYHYNGSGPQAMNGSTCWPHIKLQVSFKQGEEAERDALAKLLQETVSKFFENGLATKS